MFLSVAVLLACMAMSMAEEQCGTLQRIKVQMQWTQVYGAEADREEFATAVWKDFFRRNEKEKTRFEDVNGNNIYSSDFRAHMVRVFAGFDLLVGTLTQEEVFMSALGHYQKMHVDLGVNTAIVKEFGKSLGYVLPKFLGSSFDPAAWRPCYRIIAEGVSEA